MKIEQAGVDAEIFSGTDHAWSRWLSKEPWPMTRLSVEQFAEIADVCIAARQPGLISAFIRDGTRPEDVRRLLAKLNMQASEAAAAERFSFASLSGESEIKG